MEVHGFYINEYISSEKVFSKEFKLEGYWQFDSDEDLKKFKDKLRIALGADEVILVTTFEERQAEIDKLLGRKYWCDRHYVIIRKKEDEVSSEEIDFAEELRLKGSSMS